jgi:general secretion pathway protein B
MSFILEALKKSENERQRKIGPSLADVHVREPRSEKPWWAFAVAALLLINLAVLVIVLVRNNEPAAQTLNSAQPSVAPTTSAAPQITPAPPPERVIAPQAPVSAPAAAQPQTTTPRNPSVRSLADEAMVDAQEQAYPLQHPDLALAANVPPGPSIVRPIDGATGNARAMRPQMPPPSEPEEVLPTFRELGGTSANLPDLHLDIHVHSPMPAERFVFINMRKYIEGQSLSEGPAVERITSEGVVLNHRGLRFLLPRQ